LYFWPEPHQHASLRPMRTPDGVKPCRVPPSAAASPGTSRAVFMGSEGRSLMGAAPRVAVAVLTAPNAPALVADPAPKPPHPPAATRPVAYWTPPRASA